MRAPSSRLLLAAVAVGLFGFAASFALSWVPSLDFNEAATVISALRPWPALWVELHHVDAVHASYYALMHLWFDAVGYTPLMLRIPASIAAGTAAALLVALGTRLAGPFVGVTAGLVFAMLPETTWMGFEGRQYEASMALATAMVLLFLTARRRALRGTRAWPWWAGYALLGAISQYIFGYLFMVDIGLAAVAIAPVLRRATRTRAAASALAGFGLAVGASLAAWVPLALLELHEQGQVAWITGITTATIGEVLVTSFFPGARLLAVIGWLAAIAGAVAGTAAWWRGIRSPSARVTVIALPWLLMPTVLLLSLTALGHHLYYSRYVAFSTPALALLIAVPISWLRRLRPASTRARHLLRGALAVAALAAVAGLVAPTWVAQRQPGSKQPEAWNTIAAVITAEHAAEPRGSRDVVVFGAVPAHRVASSQVIRDVYPRAFRGMDDITLDRTYDQTSELWDTVRPLRAVVSRVRGADYVWVLTTRSSGQAQTDTAMLAPYGFTVTREWRMQAEMVLLLAHTERRAETPSGGAQPGSRGAEAGSRSAQPGSRDAPARSHPIRRV